MVNKSNLQVKVGNLYLQNPIIAASGTCGYGEELHPFIDLNRIGAIVVKGLSLTPRSGNPMPRIIETKVGILNSVGLQNVGIESFIQDKLPRLQNYQTHVIVNFFGETVEEYVEIAARADQVEGIAALEANVSCPNVKHGGLHFGSSPQMTAEVVRKVRQVTKLPIWVKLSPNVSNISEIARAAEIAGADAVSLINTVLGMSVNTETQTASLPLGFGGLSGPAIKPIALRMVYQVAQIVNIPVIGMGGIQTGEDAIEFILTGATACQVGTASFADPTSCRRIILEIEKYLKKRDISSLSDICGKLDFIGCKGE